MKIQNSYIPIVFREALAAGASKTYEAELTGIGYIREMLINFAAGENGTLHLRPYVVLNGEIVIDLLKYGASKKYFSGDDAQFRLPCYQAIEKHAKLCIDAENTGIGDSEISVDVMVEYVDILRIESVIGTPGRRP